MGGPALLLASAWARHSISTLLAILVDQICVPVDESQHGGEGRILHPEQLVGELDEEQPREPPAGPGAASAAHRPTATDPSCTQRFALMHV